MDLDSLLLTSLYAFGMFILVRLHLSALAMATAEEVGWIKSGVLSQYGISGQRSASAPRYG